MKIRSIRALRGPNYWSIRHKKLIIMVLDLEEMENYPSNKITGFTERIKKLLPGLEQHFCSEDQPGGLFIRLNEGTWMGHVIEHIALEIQSMAGMFTGFGRTRGYGEKGVYQVVFSYTSEAAGKFAAKRAVKICEALIADKPYKLTRDIQKLKKLDARSRFGPSTESILKEAESRGIPWLKLDTESFIQLGYGSKQRRIQATITSNTSNIGVDIACDKRDTKHLLSQAAIPVPAGEIISNISELEQACNFVGYPLVIKPINGNHGRGITSDIRNISRATEAFHRAKEISEKLIVEKHYSGHDYRILVINNKFVAAARRIPAQIIGDGKSTIKQLIKKVNSDPRRGDSHENLLTKIVLDAASLKLLNEKNYNPDSILPENESLIVKDTANLSTGGTAEDVTNLVHPTNIFMAERISRLIGLDICGIDIISKDIRVPLDPSNGTVIEVNAAPGFRMHLAPTLGLPRNVAAPVLDGLFPGKDKGLIPIIAITGTNGKTTTTRLIAHISKTCGKNVGYTTSDGVYIHDHLVLKGDCTGPASTELVLKDPGVDFAVLECARGGLLRSGLAFDQCDIAIVTNVASDHLGLEGIHNLEQLAKVKAVIPETVKPDGFAILNADDDLVYEMRSRLKCNIALFSMYEDNPRIKKFQDEGGLTAVFENSYVSIAKGQWKMRILKVKDIPLTYGGKAGFMIENVLASILAAHIAEFKITDIIQGLKSFIPSEEHTPGRLNLFRFSNFNFLLDYAHNPHGMRALQKFISGMDPCYKVGIIAGIGDRRDEDTEEVGAIAAEIFDEIIIRNDKDLRGNSSEHLTGLLLAGIQKIKPDMLVSLAGSEAESIKFAINQAKANSLIVLCSDSITESLTLLHEFKSKDDMGSLKLKPEFSASSN
ncbi:cyanophycin synthetase [Christiangramia salexigens]|uniref:Cyanophycin synthetase n=1 Tax=Christiangramia salexigens TaxID=1913577 RepID=A0A1L3J1N2_9FLAO|nr:cyanophycin synthetase [Christiangramia salexigens]APG59052.1 cyanophycin synthetase [Christiangramia salexigens]